MQHEFRSGFSTPTAIITLLDIIYTNIDAYKYVSVLFLDSSTINHKVLLRKLYYYGFRATVYRSESN